MRVSFLFLLCFIFLASISVSVSFARKNEWSGPRVTLHREPEQKPGSGYEEEKPRPVSPWPRPEQGQQPGQQQPEKEEPIPWQRPGQGQQPGQQQPEEEQQEPRPRPGQEQQPGQQQPEEEEPRPSQRPGQEQQPGQQQPEEEEPRPSQRPGQEQQPGQQQPEEEEPRPWQRPGQGQQPGQQQPEEEKPRPWQRPGQGQQPGQQGSKQEEQQQEEGSQGQQQHPYYFPSQRFQTFHRSELGHIRALPRFDWFTKLLRGLENYKIFELQSRPQTFFVPHHSNAHYLYVIVRGRATFIIVNANHRESYNLKRADVLVVPAGSTVYVANRDNNQNLRVIKLAIPVNNPEQFQLFYPGGQENPQSYYFGFSRQTLEASFNAPFQEIQNALLGQQGQQQKLGLIVRASKDQIRQLAQQAKSSQEGYQGQPQSGPFNIQNYETPISSHFGKMWEARPNQLPQLRALGVSVACTELRPGALFLPHFNTEKTVLMYVVQGNGTFEMACPHFSRQASQGGSGCQCQEGQQQQEEQWSVGQIRSLTAQVNEGDVYVMPPGHPTALKASNRGNLHILAFGINDENNLMNFLAGERLNMIDQIDSPAKDLTFSGSAEQVERLLRKQRQSFIVNGQPQLQQPQQGEQQQQGQESEGGLRVPLSILGAFN